MTTPLCFLDTETTSLRPDRRSWDIAVIRRDEHGTTEHQWYVDAADLDLGNADVMSLRVGGFYDRHPQWVGNHAEDVKPEAWVMTHVERYTRGAHLVAAVPSFDADVLGQRIRAVGLLPAWHHHLIDVEALSVGYLNGLRAAGALDRPVPRERSAIESAAEWLRDKTWRFEATANTTPPWKSDELSRACGVEPPVETERHTALGDARWVMRWFDALTGGAS